MAQQLRSKSTCFILWKIYTMGWCCLVETMLQPWSQKLEGVYSKPSTTALLNSKKWKTKRYWHKPFSKKEDQRLECIYVRWTKLPGESAWWIQIWSTLTDSQTQQATPQPLILLNSALMQWETINLGRSSTPSHTPTLIEIRSIKRIKIKTNKMSDRMNIRTAMG